MKEIGSYAIGSGRSDARVNPDIVDYPEIDIDVKSRLERIAKEAGLTATQENSSNDGIVAADEILRAAVAIRGTTVDRAVYGLDTA